MLYPRRRDLGLKRAVACLSLCHAPMLVVDTERYILNYSNFCSKYVLILYPRLKSDTVWATVEYTISYYFCQ